MKRLLLICGIIGLVAVPAASAGQITPSVALNEAATLGSYVDFSVVVDKGSAASVAVACYAPVSAQLDQWNGTPRFPASPGVVTVSPSVRIVAAPGSACTAYLYRWVLKPNGSWQQMIAVTLGFVSQ